MPVAFALLSSVLWGTGDFLGGTLTRRKSPFLVVGWSQAAGLVCALSLVVALGDPRAWSAVAANAAAAAAFGYAGLVLFYAALARGTMGVVAPITALGGIVPVAAGLVRGEDPSWIQGLGVVAALVGVVCASGPELSGRDRALPVVLACIAAVCFGLTLLFIADGAEFDALATVTMMRMFTTVGSIIAVVVLVARSQSRRASVPWSMAPWLFAVGAFDVFANLAFAHASTLGMLTIVAVVGSLYPVMTVVLARIIHHERLARIQQVGVVLAMTGVAVIAGA